jgi:hypothetical protein
MMKRSNAVKENERKWITSLFSVVQRKTKAHGLANVGDHVLG